jgi:phosphoserine phosphatase RsbU/P
MSDSEQLRSVGRRLLKLLNERDRAPAQLEFESEAVLAQAFTRLADRLDAAIQEDVALLRERELQLNLVLDVLRARDKAAAEQAEWDFATDLQLAGLPQNFPPFPDRTDFDIYAGMVTAKEVGGDLYDFFLLGKDRIGFVVADAAGKGLPAAIFITLTRTLLRAAAQKLDQPGDCLKIVNAILAIDNPSLMFSTAFYGVLQTNSGELLYANAGHNPPYVLRKSGAIDALPSTGEMALGILENLPYRTQRCQLAAGESVVCFSDGVTEAMDPSEALFGDERLIRVLQPLVSRAPAEVLGSIIAEVDAHMALAPMADDVTLLVIRYNGAVATKSSANS